MSPEETGYPTIVKMAATGLTRDMCGGWDMR